MKNADKITVWIVTPHADGDYDEWWGPSKTDEDHHRALAYATARLEELWDQYEGPGPVSVTIERREVNAEDMPDD
jgi:hypothetical protein